MSEVPEMVERIARAISFATHRKLTPAAPDFGTLTEMTWREFIQDAEIVLRAMREPARLGSEMESLIYRIAKNKWNVQDPPWGNAIGIEQVHLWDDGTEIFATPPLVCWFTRGAGQRELAEKIVALLNSDKEWLNERAKHHL